jgi:hypothetical protein
MLTKKLEEPNTAANQFISTHVSPKCAPEDPTCSSPIINMKTDLKPI